ncbi:hypothetical protein [Leifsonia sp. A12D58]|uniref:hypothetical protein n=1 Tax=Leifsonia sp. A12D58 TaxID=3397674 RepID=UPI0039E14C59
MPRNPYLQPGRHLAAPIEHLGSLPTTRIAVPQPVHDGGDARVIDGASDAGRVHQARYDGEETART